LLQCKGKNLKVQENKVPKINSKQISIKQPCSEYHMFLFLRRPEERTIDVLVYASFFFW